MNAVAPVAKPRLLFVVAEDWVFWLHRLDLARAARNEGFDVLVATRVQDHGKQIEDEGFRLLPTRFRRGGRHPCQELGTVRELIRHYRHTRPDIVHHVALKPVLYGSLAARLTSVPAVVNTFVGLGSVFITNSWKGRVLRSIVVIGLWWVRTLPHARTIFQNGEDRDQLVAAGIVERAQTVLIRGSGVDISKFIPLPEIPGVPAVVLASRMLGDKGVGEFVEAARLLKERGIHAKCVLVGMVDKENPSHIPESQLLAWQKAGVVEWWGHKEDMVGVFAAAHVVVLPSYREGLPRVLLEAAACARPLVATDVPGCREIVRNGENGFLVPPKDSQALFRAIATLVQDPAMRVRMGCRGREIVVSEFSAERVARETLAVYRELLGRPLSGPCASGRA